MTLTINHIQGDLFAANERAIAHGCNCHGVMGAGVAKIVRDKFERAYAEYDKACRRTQFYPGVAQPVSCVVGAAEEVTMVYNLATQNAPGANAKYEHVYDAFHNMFNHMRHVGNGRVAIPQIGAGIGGLEWERVEAVIRSAYDDHSTSMPDITVVVYTLAP